MEGWTNNSYGLQFKDYFWEKSSLDKVNRINKSMKIVLALDIDQW